MRKFALIVVLALAVPAAAAARGGDRGDGTFAVKNGSGQINITAKGTALGRVDEGQIAVIDTTPGGGDDIQVLGADRKPIFRNGVTIYRGVDMRFRIVGGWYSVTVTGTGINVSAVGSGLAALQAGNGLGVGLFSADGSKFQPIPALQTTASFGQQ